jgi:hypothetical protein
MFSRSIIGSTRFLRLSGSARLLYYDLGMEADDDGCVDAYGVMRRTGASEEDLYDLVDKGFLSFLVEEDLVVYIRDWHRNNYLRADRYRPGIYHDMVCQEQMPENPDVSTDCDLVYQRYTQDRIGQDSQVEFSSVQSKSGKDSQGDAAPARAVLPTDLDKTEAVEEIRRVEQRYDLPDQAQAVWEHFSQHNWCYRGTPVPNLANATLRWHRNICGVQTGGGNKKSPDMCQGFEKSG